LCGSFAKIDIEWRGQRTPQPVGTAKLTTDKERLAPSTTRKTYALSQRFASNGKGLIRGKVLLSHNACHAAGAAKPLSTPVAKKRVLTLKRLTISA
jgi:hypothetical protein